MHNITSLNPPSNEPTDKMLLVPIAVRLERAALLLGVPVSTFREWMAEGSAPKGFKKGKCWYFTIKTLESWGQDQTEKQAC